MEISHKKGIHFKAENEIFVDASGIKNKEALITHAHSDHAKTSSTNTYYLTPETASLINPKGASLKKVKMNKKFNLNGFDCKFVSSGHILGSAQLEVCNDITAVLTSDFKLQKSILFDGAEIIPSDVLIMEATFGRPEFIFPSREQVYEDMLRWINTQIKRKSFVVLGGYSTGKAQELTKLVNELTGETPLVYEKIFEQNNAYEKNGVKLGDYELLNHNAKDHHVLIMPPHLINDYLLLALQHELKRNVEPAIATGWKKHSRYKTFPISDHADFNDLLKYAKESEPKLVLTTHGYEEDLARSIKRKLGINARPLSRNGQKTIGEF